MIFVVSLSILILFVYTWFKAIGRGKPFLKGLKMMPIEKGLPIIGISHQIKGSMHSYLQHLGKRHGPLYEIKLGMRSVVVLNNYDVISKTLKDNSDLFSGRFETEYKKEIYRNCGFVFHDGETWRRQRAFLKTVLRESGFGRLKCTDIVNDELDHVLKGLSKIEDRRVDFYSFIILHSANIISKFLINKRLERGNQHIEYMNQLMEVTIKSQDKVELLCFMFPFLNNSPLFIKVARAFTSIPQLYEKIFQYQQTQIDDHKKRLDPNSEGEDFIDRFLIKRSKEKEIFEHESFFTDWQLVVTMSEIFGGSFETTATMLSWSCMFLSRFPEIQEKIYLEITDNVGTERRVTIADKVALNYTQAVIDEIMRLASIVPLSVPHRSFEDSNVNGFFIPKNSIIFSNIFSCHYDPEVWEDPMQFKPERFLTMNNEGALKYTSRKELIPFGIGKRQCIGESLGRVQYFTFFVNIVNNFLISSSDEITDEIYKNALQSGGFIARGCLVKEFIFKKRKK